MLSEKRAQFIKQQEKLQRRTAQDAAAASRAKQGAPAAQSNPARKPPPAQALQAQNWLLDQDKYAAMISVRNLPVGAKVKKVIEHLFLDRKPMTAKEIEDYTFVDVSADSELQERLKNNPKIAFTGDAYVYRAKHELAGKDDLLRLIRSHKDGIPMADVRDAYDAVETHVQEVRAAGQVWVLENRESKDVILYPNDPKVVIHVDDDVKQLFLGVELPREFTDLEKTLEKAGMTPTTNIIRRRLQAGLSHVQKPSQKQKKRRESKRTKYTNSHLPELFQNIQMPPGL
eukprot:jgi/Mesen1/8653/ME000502S08009